MVFDLVGGTSSEYSSRTFDANVDYSIYVHLASASENLLTDANSSVGAWGVWSGADNLDSGDKIVLVGDALAVQGKLNGTGGITQANASGNTLKWLTAAFGTADVLNNTGIFMRNNAGETATLDLWNGTVATAQFLSVGFTAMPSGVLTSQGLA